MKFYSFWRNFLMKKVLLKTAAVVLAAGLVLSIGACSKKAPAAAAAAPAAPAAAAAPANQPVTLTVWCWDPTFNIYAMNEAAKIYKTVNPNVTVNVVETPWDDVQQKLTTSLSAGQTDGLPDIVLIQDNAAEKNITTFPKAFAPVPKDKIDLSQFAQYKVGISTVDGKSYGVPFDNGASATFLRTDYLKQAGLTADQFNNITWDQFIEYGKKVKKATGKYMISAVGNENDLIPCMLESAGTWFFKNDGTIDIANNAALKEAASVYKKMVDAGIIMLAADWNGYIATLKSDVASTVNGCWIMGSIKANAEESGKWAMANTPKLNVAGGTNFSAIGGSSWYVMASSKNQAAAWDFLAKTFAGSTQLYDTILPKSGAIATWLHASKSAVYGQPDAFFGGQKVDASLVEYAGKVPQIKFGKYNYEARNNVALALQTIVKGTPIDQALAKAEKDTKFLMEQ
jgi:lactose/L-arabinose transport system substrate-binding protein